MLAHYELSKSICSTFRNCFGGCPVRFGRTSKIGLEYIGQVCNISWVHCKRKGGGFTMWLRYKDQEERPHHAILRDMVDDYCRDINSLVRLGEPLKEVKNRSVNPSRDLEIYYMEKWISVGELFPIEVRELRSQELCANWNGIRNGIRCHVEPLDSIKQFSTSPV
jgi:hypothetical protein